MRIPQWTKFLEHRHVTIAETLKQAGYQTGMVGKWHLDKRGDRNFAPIKHGFDEQHLKPPGTHGYLISPKFKEPGGSGSRYVTDYLTDKAVDFIDRHDEVVYAAARQRFADDPNLVRLHSKWRGNRSRSRRDRLPAAALALPRRSWSKRTCPSLCRVPSSPRTPTASSRGPSRRGRRTKSGASRRTLTSGKSRDAMFRRAAQLARISVPAPPARIPPVPYRS